MLWPARNLCRQLQLIVNKHISAGGVIQAHVVEDFNYPVGEALPCEDF
jgi:hypothetical protein